jgi:hypothetical protein
MAWLLENPLVLGVAAVAVLLLCVALFAFFFRGGSLEAQVSRAIDARLGADSREAGEPVRYNRLTAYGEQSYHYSHLAG